MPKGQRASKEQKKPSKAKLTGKATTPIATTAEVRPTIVTVVPEKGKRKNVA